MDTPLPIIISNICHPINCLFRKPHVFFGSFKSICMIRFKEIGGTPKVGNSKGVELTFGITINTMIMGKQHETY